jgi:amidohydrolase
MGLTTAFNACAHRAGSPVVAFMAEYDALPEVGHACGHNLNGVMSLLAGIALAEAVGDEVPGEIRVVGTPAEETNGAKVEMADKGVFDDVDFAMMVHAGSGLTKPLYRSLALVPVEFDFKGLSSHAAAAPWDGLNALNGLQLLFHSLDMLRQHVRPETRIHGVIVRGGEAPNVVPDFARGRFYFRSPSRHYLETVLEKAYDCARGAALATGTEASWRHHETSFREVLPNPEVEARMTEVLDELKIPYLKEPQSGGSTDVGNVSWKCPTMHLSLSFTDKEVAAHTREFAEIAGDRGRIETGIANGAKAMARMGLLVLTDADARKKMKDSLAQAKEAKEAKE